MELDITHWLRPGEAVLLLQADEAGPARLLAGGSEVASSGGQVVIRVRIPLNYAGRSARPPTRSDG
jgi:hypothetical protein